MSFFTKKQFKRIILPSNKDYWVEISKELSWREAKQFRNEDNSTNMIAAIDMLLLSLIKDWNLDNEDGNIVEINQENIDKLPRRDAEKLVEAVTDVVVKQAESVSQKKSSSKKLPVLSAEGETPQ